MVDAYTDLFNNFHYATERIKMFNIICGYIIDLYAIDEEIIGDNYNLSVIESIEDKGEEYLLTGKIDRLISYSRIPYDDGTYKVEQEFKQETHSIAIPKFILDTHSLNNFCQKSVDFILHTIDNSKE